MPDNDNPNDLDILAARFLGMLDVTSRLLAYEARRHPDPSQFFLEFSDATAARIRRATTAEPINPIVIGFQEIVQNEVDRLIGNARALLEEPPNPSSPHID